LEAAAVLHDRNDPRVTTLVATIDGHVTFIAARDPDAARSLGRSLRYHLQARALNGCHINLGPMAVTEASLTLAEELHGLLAIRVEDRVPQLRRDHRDRAEDYMSDNMRRTLRKARNRLTQDNHDTAIEFTMDASRILNLLPAMAAAHRERDRHHGLSSLLDTAAGQSAWHLRISTFLRANALEVGILTVDNRLGAYVLALPDRDSYRILEGCFSSEFSRYSPGRLLEAAALQRMLDQREYTHLDWMTSVATETLIAQNHDQEVLLLVSDHR
jgi:CelD/BcsL family acetyltransferase involved in cellulose biosynthesis